MDLPPPTQRRKPPIFPSPPSPPTITRRRRRRRQLLFWDKETQISREKFQEQLQTKAHCWEYVSTSGPGGGAGTHWAFISPVEAPGTFHKVHIKHSAHSDPTRHP